jgi:hypothetical protein
LLRVLNFAHLNKTLFFILEPIDASLKFETEFIKNN